MNVGHENLSLALVGIHDNLRSQAIFILTFEKENMCFWKEEHDAIKPSHISLINYLESMAPYRSLFTRLKRKLRIKCMQGFILWKHKELF